MPAAHKLTAELILTSKYLASAEPEKSPGSATIKTVTLVPPTAEMHGSLKGATGVAPGNGAPRGEVRGAGTGPGADARAGESGGGAPGAEAGDCTKWRPIAAAPFMARRQVKRERRVEAAIAYGMAAEREVGILFR